MRSEGPKMRRRELPSKAREFAHEILDGDGWVETDELLGSDPITVYAEIGRTVAEVVYRHGTTYGQMRRDDE